MLHPVLAIALNITLWEVDEGLASSSFEQPVKIEANINVSSAFRKNFINVKFGKMPTLSVNQFSASLFTENKEQQRLEIL